MQVLSVINRMLGSMGEDSLASLEDPHQFKGDGIAMLDLESRSIQARGWWFNEEAITLTPMLNGKIILPGDLISVRTPTANVVQRGQYLYNLDGGTNIFTEAVDVKVVRLVKFDELPETAAAYISACAVRKFQMMYDADRDRTQALAADESRAYAAANTEDTRNRRGNLLLSNTRLARLKFITNQARRFIR